MRNPDLIFDTVAGMRDALKAAADDGWKRLHDWFRNNGVA